MTALTLAAAYVLGTLATARATRLLTHDAFPPAQALRLWWWNHTIAKGGRRADWHLLFVGERPDEPGCPWCLHSWLTLAVLTVATIGGVWSVPGGWSLEGVFWYAAVWGSSSYLGSAFIVRDEPED